MRHRFYRVLFWSWAVSVLPVFAAPSYERQTADFSKPAIQNQWNISLKQGMNGYEIPFDFVNGQNNGTNVPIDMSGWTISLAMRRPTGSDAARLTGSVSTTSGTFTTTSNFLASAVQDWTLVLVAENGDSVVNQASGRISIERSPELDSGDLEMTRSISIPLYTWTGTFSTSNIPMADILAYSIAYGFITNGISLDTTNLVYYPLTISLGTAAYSNASDFASAASLANYYLSSTVDALLLGYVSTNAAALSDTLSRGNTSGANDIILSANGLDQSRRVGFTVNDGLSTTIEYLDSIIAGRIRYAGSSLAYLSDLSGYVGTNNATYTQAVERASTAFGWGDHAGLYDTTGTAAGIGNAISDVIAGHTNDTANPHEVTAAQAGAVATNAPDYLNLKTNTATAAQGVLADGALPKSGGETAPMTGDLYLNYGSTTPKVIQSRMIGTNSYHLMRLGQTASGSIVLSNLYSTNSVTQWNFGIGMETNRFTITGDSIVLSGNTAISGSLTIGGRVYNPTTNWIASTVVASASTVTITSATASPLTLDLTNNTILSYSVGTFPTTQTGMVFQAVQYKPNSFSFGLDTNTLSGTLPTPTTNAYNIITIIGAHGATRAEVH